MPLEKTESNLRLEEIADLKGIEPSHIEQTREKIASILAVIVTSLLVIFLLIPIFKPSAAEYIKDILPVLTTFVGMAFGFYFSEKRLQG